MHLLGVGGLNALKTILRHLGVWPGLVGSGLDAAGWWLVVGGWWPVGDGTARRWRAARPVAVATGAVAVTNGAWWVGDGELGAKTL